MGFLSLGGSFAVALMIFREENLYQSVNAIAGRFLLRWDCLAFARGVRKCLGDGAELWTKYGALAEEPRRLLGKLVNDTTAFTASSRKVEVEAGVDIACVVDLVQGEPGFKVLASGGRILRDITNSGRGKFEVGYGHGKLSSLFYLISNVLQRSPCACNESRRTSEVRVLAYGKERMQSVGLLTAGEVTNCKVQSSETAHVKEMNHRNFDMNSVQSTQFETEGTATDTKREDTADELYAATDCDNLEHEIVLSSQNLIRQDNSVGLRNCGNGCQLEDLLLSESVNTRRFWPDGLLRPERDGRRGDLDGGAILNQASQPSRDDASSTLRNLASQANAYSESSEGTTHGNHEDAQPIDQIEQVQSNDRSVPVSKPQPDNCGREEGSQYPVPLSPLSGEVAKSIEYERAMVAETAMKSGPAMTRSKVLFEDEWLLVINKPSGVYCEHVLATVPSLLTPAALQARESPLSRLILRRPVANKDSSDNHLHMANRLDRDTSGLMVITKCRSAAGKLSNMFTKRLVQKSYVALCRGPKPSWESVTIDSGHGRSRFGAWRVYSKKDVGRSLPGGSVVRDMTTHLLVMAINKKTVPGEQVVGRTFEDKLSDAELVIAGNESSSNILRLCSSSEEPSSESDEVVIRAFPLTGRTHQIRLHCQFLGLPLRGDVKYGGPHCVSGVRYNHHALHAESLAFEHPFTFEKLNFVAPLPLWAIDAGVQPLVW